MNKSNHPVHGLLRYPCDLTTSTHPSRQPVAHTGDPDQPLVQWDNPFRASMQGHGAQWHDDEIGVAGCLLSLVEAIRNGSEPTYGPHQGRLGQELILALRISAEAEGKPIKLPLDPNAQAI